MLGRWRPDSAGGYVINPAYNEFLCSWAVDGGTMNRKCDPPGPAPDRSCVPGCTGREPWCEDAPWSNYCPWGRGHLTDMVRQHLQIGPQRYNEVIVDAHVYEAKLPRSIEAVYFSSNEGKARDIHQKIVDHFGLRPSQIPLLRVDMHASAPFTFVG